MLILFLMNFPIFTIFVSKIIYVKYEVIYEKKKIVKSFILLSFSRKKKKNNNMKLTIY